MTIFQKQTSKGKVEYSLGQTMKATQGDEKTIECLKPSLFTTASFFRARMLTFRFDGFPDGLQVGCFISKQIEAVK